MEFITSHECQKQIIDQVDTHRNRLLALLHKVVGKLQLKKSFNGFFAALTIFALLLLSACANNAAPPEASTEPLETVALTGNVFLDAEVKSYPAGKSVIHTIRVDKESALEASEEDYAEFVSERLEPSFAEAFALLFDDGTYKYQAYSD